MSWSIRSFTVGVLRQHTAVCDVDTPRGLRDRALVLGRFAAGLRSAVDASALS
jgi:hypothetical protein